MSTLVVPYPIVAALTEAEGMEGMGANRQWNAKNLMQTRFLQEFFATCRDEVDTIPEIESLASWDVNEINAFLQARGFTIALQPFNDDTFGVASVLDLLVKWLVKGDVTVLQARNHRDYPGVRMDMRGIQIYESSQHAHPVALLQTTTGDGVYMTVYDGRVADGFDLVDLAETIGQNLERSYDFDGLQFPMVDLDHAVDISWLIGMDTEGTDGRPARITQALQQTMLKMNEVGARAKSAVAIAVTREAFVKPKPDMVIDQPFLIWFERRSLSRSLFVGHITEDDWGNPGDITK